MSKLFHRQITADFVTKIEFDVDKQNFVVTTPSTRFYDFGSAKEIVIEPPDFKMLS